MELVRTFDTDFRKFPTSVAEPVGATQGHLGMLLSVRSVKCPRTSRIVDTFPCQY